MCRFYLVVFYVDRALYLLPFVSVLVPCCAVICGWPPSSPVNLTGDRGEGGGPVGVRCFVLKLYLEISSCLVSLFDICLVGVLCLFAFVAVGVWCGLFGCGVAVCCRVGERDECRQ